MGRQKSVKLVAWAVAGLIWAGLWAKLATVVFALLVTSAGPGSWLAYGYAGVVAMAVMVFGIGLGANMAYVFLGKVQTDGS